ncbi:MAG: ErfK/YbiS/YcfS/YnhG family protein [Bryobacterales bacterium]|nr:ErfK/YbiS/YcfS/YnhG family protein [Bryobacterales bacterium]
MPTKQAQGLVSSRPLPPRGLALILLMVILGPLQAANPRARTSPTGYRLKRTIIHFDPAIINNSNLLDPLGPGNRGSAVLRAQILLDRAGYSCGEMDGYYGRNLQNTVSAFQKSQGLPENGRIGPETWTKLNADPAPTLQTYTIAEGDVSGPFEKVPEAMQDKAKLQALNFESPLEALGEKFHCSPESLVALNPGKQFDKSGETILAPNIAITPARHASMIVIDKTDSSVTALDPEGRTIAYFSATIGSEHDPLPLGKWKILGLKRNPVFHYNPSLFWDADGRDSKADVAPGPNNPVGVVWIALSKQHYGIHGTPEPGTIGHTQSHGCIRLTNWDALQLADMVRPGTPALLKK